jgi:hypothetical protein
VGGPNGAIVLAATLMVTTSLILYGLARRFVPPTLAAFLMAVALMVSSPRFVPRPELLSFVYFAVYLVLLEGYPRNGRAIYLLVPLQILWVNTQGIFAVGVALIGCYWLGAALAFLPVPRGWRQESALTPVQWRQLTVVLVLVVLACFVNPWGVEGALFPFQLLPRVTGSSLFSSRIGEFRAPLRSGYAPPLVYTWLSLLVATGLSFLANVGRWHLGRLLAALAFGVLSTQSLRNMAFFGWVAVPVIAANLGPWVQRWRLPPWLRGGLAFAALAAIVTLTGAVVTNQLSRLMQTEREFGRGVSNVRFPAAAIAFIEHTGITGRAFNCLAMGGYLAWTRPGDSVFVDGRLEAFPESVFASYFQAMDQPATWPTTIGPYALDYALLYHGWSNRLRLVNSPWPRARVDDGTTTRSRRCSFRATRRTARSASVPSIVRGHRRQAAASAGSRRRRQRWSRALSFPVAESWRRVLQYRSSQHRLSKTRAAAAFQRSSCSTRTSSTPLTLGFATGTRMSGTPRSPNGRKFCAATRPTRACSRSCRARPAGNSLGARPKVGRRGPVSSALSW